MYEITKIVDILFKKNSVHKLFPCDPIQFILIISIKPVEILTVAVVISIASYN
jgi:hypothetical protein